MQRIKNNTLKFFLIAVTFFVTVPVFASEFYFKSDKNTILSGEEVRIDLLLDTKGENINAVEGEIILAEPLLKDIKIIDGNSIVNFWIERPRVGEGRIIFSGITPGSYNLPDAFIFSIILKSESEGDYTFNIKNANALLNDGNGTKSKITTKSFILKVLSEESITKDEKIIDKTKPDSFLPEISQDINLFDNKWFIVFASQDKGLGIDKYEIRESKYNIFNFSRWEEAKSPHILNDQELSNYIEVKAIDKAGNYRIVKLNPKNPIPWYANFENWFIIILVILVAAVFYFKKVKNLSK